MENRTDPKHTVNKPLVPVSGIGINNCKLTAYKSGVIMLDCKSPGGHIVKYYEPEQMEEILWKIATENFGN